MRDPDRIVPLARELIELWQQYPDLRLGQLLVILASPLTGPAPDIFHIEDDELLRRIRAGFPGKYVHPSE